jgi:hypothetical protein
VVQSLPDLRTFGNESNDPHLATADRRVIENKDFLEYVKLVKQFYQTGEARLVDWGVPKEVDQAPSDSRRVHHRIR